MRNLAIAFAAVPLGAGVAPAEAVDWNAAGALRETKVWVAALDGRGYVRTNDSRWFQNLVREPNAAIRFGDAEYPVRAEVVGDAALRARVDAVFAEKYPFSMWVAGIFGRSGGVNCVAFSAREP